MGERIGRVEPLTGSGSVISSRICSISASAARVCFFRLESFCCFPAALDLDFSILINDAGVAGSPFESTAIAAESSACLGGIWGDFPAELDLGVAGGGIKTSESGSGETESASELS